MTHAELFLRRLGGDEFTFQTFDDRKAKRFYLAKQFHASLGEVREQLIRWNGFGVGIFVCINETDLQGRRAENVTRVRALFADLDGSPIEPVLSAGLQPHMVVQSSEDRYHAYWMVEDCSLSDFGRYQKALAKRFDADPVVCDLPRVMRLPGFYHCKGRRQSTYVLSVDRSSPYSLSLIEKGLELDVSDEVVVKEKLQGRVESMKPVCAVDSGGWMTQGVRNSSLFRIASAMRGRGESWEYAVDEILRCADRCSPPFPASEAIEVLSNVWGRYQVE